jgi:hypothetical protein
MTTEKRATSEEPQAQSRRSFHSHLPMNGSRLPYHGKKSSALARVRFGGSCGSESQSC